MNLWNSWQFYTGVFIVLSILFNQFYKFISRQGKSIGASTVTFQLLAGITILFFIPFYKFTFPSSPISYFLILLSSLFYTIHNRLQTQTRKHLDVSVVVIISGISVVALFLYGLIALNEQFLLSKILGCILILAANVYLFYKKGKLNLNKYVLLNALAWICYSAAIAIDVANSGKFNIPIYAALVFFIPMLMISFYDKVKPKDILLELKSRTKNYLLTSIPLGLLVIANLRALQLGEFSKVNPLEATAVLLNVIVAHIFFHEREDLFKKIVASLLVVAGIYLTILK